MVFIHTSQLSIFCVRKERYINTMEDFRTSEVGQTLYRIPKRNVYSVTWKKKGTEYHFHLT